MDGFLHDISARAFTPEPECVAALLPHTERFQSCSEAIFRRAEGYVRTLRAKEQKTGIAEFLKEYGLNTKEGVVLMCLAEALLRIPDAITADALIHDKLKNTKWEKHLGRSESLFVNASTWGLMLTGRFVTFTDVKGSIGALLSQMVARLGEPLVRTALKKTMELMGGQFVLGEDIETALRRAETMMKKGYRFSFDMLGESAHTQAQANHFHDTYRKAIAAIGKKAGVGGLLYERPSVSVKLSALHPRYEWLKQARVMDELLPRVESLAAAARKNNIGLSIDAEETWRLDLMIRFFQALALRPALKEWEGLGFVLQAYHRRARSVVDFLASLAEERGTCIPIRLVKGAYWDSEIKRAQQLGLPDYPVFTRKSHTDVSYLACAARILEHPGKLYPQFASHNALTVAAILETAKGINYEFQRLHGMGEEFYDLVIREKTCRVYAPVGGHRELLPYLIRRLLENSANTSFLHQLIDEEQPVRLLLRDPVKRVQQTQGVGHPDLPEPRKLYTNRKNSEGFDLGCASHIETLRNGVKRYTQRTWQAAPIVNGRMQKGEARPVFSPADTREIVGSSICAKTKQVDTALQCAAEFFPVWNNTEAAIRAALLEKCADTLEENRDELITLCLREAGKTLSDAIAEVREAADFCRYYALEARRLFATPQTLPGYTGERNELSLHGRGVFACISPWNFPLAIFTGQVAAALAAGNTVVAKPAEQTALIACRAIQFIHKAGIPREAIHLLPGNGSIGAALVGDKRIAGVAFTGSTETARLINQALAARDGAIVPFIAETGGQNCMIVDSTALPEQATDDIVLSAFGSAGQRCSALRILCVQEEIAENLLSLLKGAMRELKIGNPLDFTTDIGPVIDAEAKTALENHIQKMSRNAMLIAKSALDPAIEKQGHFVAPHAFEIKDMRVLEREIFGPILHVIRYKANQLDETIDAVNKTGYGLTFAIHSRITERVEYVRQRIHAGNFYVNRSMTGAVVGVQPFGGEGLSGTGPKAGGPHYLQRFAVERTFTDNTAAIGGNIELLK